MRRTLESTFKRPKPEYHSLSSSKTDGPYYDPYDIHIHKWVTGVIKNPQNHKEPIYDFAPENGDTYKRESIL